MYRFAWNIGKLRYRGAVYQETRKRPSKQFKSRPRTGVAALLLLFGLLVGANELRGAEDVAGERLFEFRFGWRIEIRQDRVERVEFEEIAVSADRWTRAAVAGAFPVVLSFE